MCSRVSVCCSVDVWVYVCRSLSLWYQSVSVYLSVTDFHKYLFGHLLKFASLIQPVNDNIILAVISVALYLTDKGEHTALYKINENVYIKT